MKWTIGEIEWKRQPVSETSEVWYSTFVSPAGNLHYFTLDLNPNFTGARLQLEVQRQDGLKINPDFRVHVETSSPFIALLAKDRNKPEGMLSMILHPDESIDGMRGEIIWNSLTDKAGKVIRVKGSQEIMWTRMRSPEHPTSAPIPHN